MSTTHALHLLISSFYHLRFAFCALQYGIVFERVDILNENFNTANPKQLSAIIWIVID